jgi:hypothetical protein
VIGELRATKKNADPSTVQYRNRRTRRKRARAITDACTIKPPTVSTVLGREYRMTHPRAREAAPEPAISLRSCAPLFGSPLRCETFLKRNRALRSDGAAVDILLVPSQGVPGNRIYRTLQ